MIPVPLLTIHPKEVKAGTQTDTSTPGFKAASFTRAKIQKQPKCSATDEWLKMWSIYTMEDYSVIRRNFAICNNMHGLGGHCANK